MKTQLSSVKTTQFTLTTPKYVVNTYNKGSIRVGIYIQTLKPNVSSYRLDINSISTVLAHINATPLANIDLFIDGGAPTKDAELKASLIKQLQITEYVLTTTVTLKPLSAQMIQTIQNTIASQKEIVGIMTLLQKNITDLSIKDCNKLKSALGPQFTNNSQIGI